MSSIERVRSLGWDQLDELYRETILDHYRTPRNRAPLDDAQIKAHGHNPFCGDEVIVQIKLDDGRVAQVGVQGAGCSISQASASMMSELLRGKSLDQVLALAHLFKRLMRSGDLSPVELESLGDLEALSGVRHFPVRIKCALLAWTTLEEGIKRLTSSSSKGKG
ncbi:MAG: SUF system NifU family Fe-S cluster assembly protein [Chloroflexi bacterium]|nr:SUF system NifU family Fe-S cluster assembly protein [Chloroflexota bacterium]